MKTTVKRALWQRTLETAGPLRRPLPRVEQPDPFGLAVEQFCEALSAASPQCGAGLAMYLCWHDTTEFRRQEDGSMKPFRWSRGSYITDPIVAGGVLARCRPTSALVDEIGWPEPKQGDDFKPEQAKRTALFGMDFAAGGVRDQTGVCLVGESGPELVLTIPAGKLKVGEPVDFGDLFLLALPQMVREMNEGQGGAP